MSCSPKRATLVTEVIEVPVPVFEKIAEELLVPCKPLRYWAGMTFIELVEAVALHISEDVLCAKRLKEIENNNSN